jgi:hypothetical protein
MCVWMNLLPQFFISGINIWIKEVEGDTTAWVPHHDIYLSGVFGGLHLSCRFIIQLASILYLDNGGIKNTRDIS